MGNISVLTVCSLSAGHCYEQPFLPVNYLNIMYHDFITIVFSYFYLLLIFVYLAGLKHIPLILLYHNLDLSLATVVRIGPDRIATLHNAIFYMGIVP